VASLSGIIEFGFVDQQIEETPAGVIVEKSSPTATGALNDFTIATRDASDNAFFGLVSLGQDNAIGAGTNSKAVPIANETELTLMVATNEQTETTLWVNGMQTDVERSGPSRYSDLAIWLFADTTSLVVDYIQSWQERVSMIS